jgi:hypothetical protein
MKRRELVGLICDTVDLPLASGKMLQQGTR